MLIFRGKLLCCATVATACVLGACAVKPIEPTGPTAIDIINERMAKAVEAQQDLASITVAKTKLPNRQRIDVFSDHVTLDYVGDIEGVLRRIAKQYNFRFEAIGKNPPEGLVVNVYYPEPKPVIDILKGIAYQHPDIVDVNVGKDTIELVYKKR